MKQLTTIGCINKRDIQVTYDEHSARYIGEVLQNHEYIFLLNGIKKKEDLTIVDIGGNIGTFSLYVYDIAKIIYSIEPFKEVIAMLEETIKENKLDKIKPRTMAIGGSTGKGMMSLTSPVSGGGGFLSSEGNVEVDVMTLNDFCIKEEITHINLLKIDCEGEEQTILETTDFEKLPVDCIIGEIHVGRVNKDNFFSVLKQKGFKTKEFGGNRFLATI